MVLIAQEQQCGCDGNWLLRIITTPHLFETEHSTGTKTDLRGTLTSDHVKPLEMCNSAFD